MRDGGWKTLRLHYRDLTMKFRALSERIIAVYSNGKLFGCTPPRPTIDSWIVMVDFYRTDENHEPPYKSYEAMDDDC